VDGRMKETRLAQEPISNLVIRPPAGLDQCAGRYALVDAREGAMQFRQCGEPPARVASKLRSWFQSQHFISL
jgi:hypothetical protein